MAEQVPGQEPWQWAEPVWRAHVERVRAGRSLLPATWPGGARVAVALSFDSDHETLPLRNNITSPGELSIGEYGARAGAPRVLRLLAEFGIPASFYVPAVSALLHPAEVKSYVEAGHEVALHGWIHERNTLLDAPDERDLLFRAADTLEEITGVRPVGMRTPSWDFSHHTLTIARELGLVYDSSLMADDDPYELIHEGEHTGMVELPVEWIRDDAPYFVMARFDGVRPYTPPRAVLGIWQDEFRAALAEGGLFQLTMHPHIIGHRSRLVVLRELIEEMHGAGGVWFATHASIAEYCRESAGLNRP
ncbi:MAG TPA: polysaccharide deacetylase [Pseudonocardiaceae bacterium]|jgi:peptidoglycan/xylan/chitin deacetylase (PgdA/CDA1 family)